MATVNENSLIQSGVHATLDDLYRVEGKAELIGGRIVHFMASGMKPSEVAFDIAISLREHVKRTNVGKAFADGIGYALRPRLSSGRESFSPDASYYAGPLPANAMRFIEGAPTFAVEVRSEDDYGSGAERELAEKRADYFEAGTLVVWDVDPLARTITCYRSPARAASIARMPAAPPTLFKSGDTADAEPAVPGWKIGVNEVFGPAVP